MTRHCCRQEYDGAQFDALCICLECEAGPRQKLCDWLLELSIYLVRPDVLPHDESIVSSSFSGSHLLSKERFTYFVDRVAQALSSVLLGAQKVDQGHLR